MNSDELSAKIAAELDAQPRVPGIDWPMALAVMMLRELEARMPGFRDAVKARIVVTGDTLAGSADPEEREDAPSLHELAASWVFTGASAADVSASDG